ncbi:MAG: hypothetical protein QF886_19920, partial [Planctomycetota bacterium]|nr:hypothetical protein [Planctomycetota bacterium]
TLGAGLISVPSMGGRFYSRIKRGPWERSDNSPGKWNIQLRLSGLFLASPVGHYRRSCGVPPQNSGGETPPPR